MQFIKIVFRVEFQLINLNQSRVSNRLIRFFLLFFSIYHLKVLKTRKPKIQSHPRIGNTNILNGLSSTYLNASIGNPYIMIEKKITL